MFLLIHVLPFIVTTIKKVILPFHFPILKKLVIWVLTVLIIIVSKVIKGGLGESPSTSERWRTLGERAVTVSIGVIGLLSFGFHG